MDRKLHLGLKKFKNALYRKKLIGLEREYVEKGDSEKGRYFGVQTVDNWKAFDDFE